jgi:hypothetical protein
VRIATIRGLVTRLVVSEQAWMGSEGRVESGAGLVSQVIVAILPRHDLPSLATLNKPMYFYAEHPSLLFLIRILGFLLFVKTIVVAPRVLLQEFSGATKIVFTNNYCYLNLTHNSWMIIILEGIL